MAHYGLSSQEAQEKLHSQLEHVCHTHVKVDWLRELRQPPFTPLVCLGTALAGLVLIVDFLLAPVTNGSTLFQGFVLLLLCILNSCLFYWDVYIIKTRRIRRLLSKIKPFLKSICPWTARSYPSRSINTLRGQFTVHAHRDRQIVNLPTSLVVQGDVIELYKDVPLPASATLLDSDCLATRTHVEMGECPPAELFQNEEGVQNICYVEEEKRIKFVVTQTPIIADFLSILQKKRPTSILTREKTYILLTNNILILVTLGVSFLINLIRYTALTDDIGHWTEMLLQLQVYTVLPQLQLLFSFVWTLMNLYGTAKIVLLTEKRSQDTLSFWPRLRDTWDVLKKMLVLLVCPSKYPNYRVFHILGSLTSLCSVDKEYVLTDSAPVPEKVFFLTRRDNPPQNVGEQPEERKEKNVHVPLVQTVEKRGAEQQIESKHGDRCKLEDTEGLRKEQFQSQANEDGQKRLVHVHVEIETASVDGVLSTPLTAVQDDKVAKSTLELKRSDRLPSAEVIRADSDPIIPISASHSNNGPSATEEVSVAYVDNTTSSSCVADKPNPKKKPTRFLSLDSAPLPEPSQTSRAASHEDGSQTDRLSQAMSSSALSLASPFELVREILDLSPNYSTLSGLGFDDVNWESFLGSLKPIGVNTLATSHLMRDPYSWSPRGCSEYVRGNILKTSCVCSLGMEIGVNEYLQGNFTNEVLIFGVSDPSPPDENKVPLMRRPSTSLPTESVIQPHILSSVLKDVSSGNYLVMSRGSGDMVAACCSDFWDGKDLQPMTTIERDEIKAFFARRHLTSYCVTLSYNPLVDTDISPLLQRNIALYVPIEKIQRPLENIKHQFQIQSVGEQVFFNLLCNQVFLGVVSLQFQPKADIVSLIEGLEATGIRFVYFTNENEVRGKVFAEKLGLEAGWNCHISLAPGSEDEGISSDSQDEQVFQSCSSSTSSSLSSVINAFQSYIRAKLPKGIHNVRPHLKNVDNVPLLVPLFTDCMIDAIREMIEIMQENGEVVMCLGNAWNQRNLSIFAQADISLSIIPECAGLQCCLDEDRDDRTLSTSVSDNNYFGNPPQLSDPDSLTWPTPLEMASYLNTAMCQLCVHRRSNISILELVTESRHVVSCIRHGLLFGLGSNVSMTILMLAATFFFLPPPLSGGHIFWFLLFSIPMLVLSFLLSTFDTNIKTQMPSRKKKVLNEKFLGLAHFCCTFLPSAFVSLLLFALTLASICTSDDGDSSGCHPLLGNRSESSSWNGWRGVNEQGLWLAQDMTALFFSLYLVAHSIRFVHRTAPIWQLYKYVSWEYVTAASLTVILQVLYFIVSQTVVKNTYQLSESYGVSTIPPYVWVVGISWCVPLVFIHELLKCQDRKLTLKLQRHLKLEFETKLGMNSPF